MCVNLNGCGKNVFVNFKIAFFIKVFFFGMFEDIDWFFMLFYGGKLFFLYICYIYGCKIG